MVADKVVLDARHKCSEFRRGFQARKVFKRPHTRFLVYILGVGAAQTLPRNESSEVFVTPSDQSVLGIGVAALRPANQFWTGTWSHSRPHLSNSLEKAQKGTICLERKTPGPVVQIMVIPSALLPSESHY